MAGPAPQICDHWNFLPDDKARRSVHKESGTSDSARLLKKLDWNLDLAPHLQVYGILIILELESKGDGT